MYAVLLSQIAFSGCAFGLSIYAARYLDFNQLGELTTLLVFWGVAMSLSESYTDRFVYSRNRHGLDLSLGKAIRFDFLYSAFFFGILAIIYFYLYKDIILICITLAMIFYIPAKRLRIKSELADRYWESRTPVLWASGGTILLMCLFYIFQKNSLIDIFVLRTVIFLVELAFSLIVFRNVVLALLRRPVSTDVSFIDIYTYVWPFILANIFVVLYNNLDYFFISYVIDESSMGVYFFVFQIHAQILVFRRVIISYVFPKYFAKTGSKISETVILKLLFQFSLISGCIFLLYVEFFEAIIPLVIGEKWIQFKLLFFVNFILIIERFSLTFVEPYLASVQKTKLVSRITGLNLLLLVAGLGSILNVADITLVSLIVLLSLLLSNYTVLIGVFKKWSVLLILLAVRCIFYTIGYNFV